MKITIYHWKINGVIVNEFQNNKKKFKVCLTLLQNWIVTVIFSFIRTVSLQKKNKHFKNYSMKSKKQDSSMMYVRFFDECIESIFFSIGRSRRSQSYSWKTTRTTTHRKSSSYHRTFTWRTSDCSFNISHQSILLLDI